MQRQGYEAKLPLGSSDLDQILTDTNVDYAEYHIFIRKKEAKFVHVDIHDKEFARRCPSDGSDLIEIEEMPPLRRPRSNRDSLVMEENRPTEEKNTRDTLTCLADQLKLWTINCASL